MILISTILIFASSTKLLNIFSEKNEFCILGKNLINSSFKVIGLESLKICTVLPDLAIFSQHLILFSPYPKEAKELFYGC